MDFKSPYLHALRERAPKMFMDLRRHGRLEQHLDLKSKEAHEMLRDLLQGKEHPSLPEQREAEEIVRQTLIEFPPEHRDLEMAEPPDDLPDQNEGAGNRPKRQ